ncbi:MAG: hypothetical protein M3137_19070, partial [Actinomycetota bacterium]|nr:hypothetical protein [Actinomycetota bacterium]
MSEIALARHTPVVFADLLPGTLVRDVVLVVGAASFVGVLAQIWIHLAFTPVRGVSTGLCSG